MKTDIQIAFEARRCVMRWSDGNAGDYPAEKLVDDLEKLLVERAEPISSSNETWQTRERVGLATFLLVVVLFIICMYKVVTIAGPHLWADLIK
jgi:hypothetical protein